MNSAHINRDSNNHDFLHKIAYVIQGLHVRIRSQRNIPSPKSPRGWGRELCFFSKLTTQTGVYNLKVLTNSNNYLKTTYNFNCTQPLNG